MPPAIQMIGDNCPVCGFPKSGADGSAHCSCPVLSEPAAKPPKSKTGVSFGKVFVVWIAGLACFALLLFLLENPIAVPVLFLIWMGGLLAVLDPLPMPRVLALLVLFLFGFVLMTFAALFALCGVVGLIG